MSYKILIVKYKCNSCGKELVIENTPENYNNVERNPSPECNCPKGWDWTSPAECYANEHYCEDSECQDACKKSRNK